MTVARRGGASRDRRCRARAPPPATRIGAGDGHEPLRAVVLAAAHRRAEPVEVRDRDRLAGAAESESRAAPRVTSTRIVVPAGCAKAPQPSRFVHRTSASGTGTGGPLDEDDEAAVRRRRIAVVLGVRAAAADRSARGGSSKKAAARIGASTVSSVARCQSPGSRRPAEKSGMSWPSGLKVSRQVVPPMARGVMRVSR